MKKLLFSTVLFLSLVIISSCSNSSNPDYVSLKNCLPLDIGNYWIYETYLQDSFGNRIGKKTIDSLVIVDMLEIDGIKAYQFFIIKNNYPPDTGYICADDSRIMLHGKLLHPFMNSYHAPCYTMLEPGFYELALCDREKWSWKDSMPADDYPTLVDDGQGGFITVVTKTIWIVDHSGKRNEIRPVVISGNSYSATSYKMETKRLRSIIEPDSISFKRDETSKMKYSDNDRTIQLNEIELEISFVNNIGISDTKETTKGENGHSIFQRKLLRYHIN